MGECWLELKPFLLSEHVGLYFGVLLAGANQGMFLWAYSAHRLNVNSTAGERAGGRDED